MYVNPFVAGVLSTMIAEIVLFTVSVCIFSARENKRRKEQNLSYDEKQSKDFREDNKQY